MTEVKKEIKWGYPKSLEEAISFFKKGYIPHGGGTTLIRSGLGSVKGLFTVSELPEMRGISLAGDEITLGAGLTYSEIVESVSEFREKHLLVKALSHAASNPLRNRITIGGSINVFPYWSDAVGPLVALGAKLKLVDGEGSRQSLDIDEYISNREIRKNTFIVSVGIGKSEVMSFYHREVRTHFDYPFFTVSILISPVEGDVRIVVTGVRGRYKRLVELESFFKEIISDFLREAERKEIRLVESFGKDFSGLKDEVESRIDASFINRQGVSGEYQRHVSGVVIRRGVWKILIEGKE